MLNNPKHGWCDIEILGFKITGASYLEDYPIAFADALNNWGDDEDEETCSVRVDRESQGWVTVLFGADELTISTFDGEDPDDREVFSAALDRQVIDGMRRELADDIEKHFDEWTSWSFADSSRERVERREELEQVVMQLRER